MAPAGPTSSCLPRATVAASRGRSVVNNAGERGNTGSVEPGRVSLERVVPASTRKTGGPHENAELRAEPGRAADADWGPGVHRLRSGVLVPQLRGQRLRARRGDTQRRHPGQSLNAPNPAIC